MASGKGSKELRAYIKKLEKLEKDIPELMTELAAHEGEVIVGMIKERTATVTSLLKNSWRSYTSPLLNSGKSATVWITNHTEYASFYEKGHRLVNKDGKTIGWVQGRFPMRMSVKIYKDRLMKANIQRFVDRKIKAYLDG